MTFTVTRNEIINAACTAAGSRFRHQGRDVDTGLDCVGLLVHVGRLIGYPKIHDVEGYRRTPSAQVIREVLGMNCDEIPLDEVAKGDIYLMRIGGRKPRHAAIRISDETDVNRGIEPMLIHANGQKGRVVIDAVSNWEKGLVAGFRIRGLVD